jgi:hypothetical protein
LASTSLDELTTGFSTLPNLEMDIDSMTLPQVEEASKKVFLLVSFTVGSFLYYLGCQN